MGFSIGGWSGKLDLSDVTQRVAVGDELGADRNDGEIASIARHLVTPGNAPDHPEAAPFAHGREEIRSGTLAGHLLDPLIVAPPPWWSELAHEDVAYSKPAPVGFGGPG